jgi:hypothetical protein
LPPWLIEGRAGLIWLDAMALEASGLEQGVRYATGLAKAQKRQTRA